MTMVERDEPWRKDLEIGMFVDNLEFQEDAAILGVIQQENEPIEEYRRRVEWSRSKAIWDLMTGLKLIDPNPTPYRRGAMIREKFERYAYFYWAENNGILWEIAEGAYCEQHGGEMGFPEAFTIYRERLEKKVLQEEGLGDGTDAKT